MRNRKAKTKSSILDSAVPIEDMSRVITALFYGRSGTGKTSITGTFPTPLLVLDIGERGTDSLDGVPGVKVLKVNSWADFEEVYWDLKKNKHGFKSVSIDSLHSLQALACVESKLRDKKDEDSPMSQRLFGQASALAGTWCLNYRDLQDLGINVVFTCHDKTFEVDVEDGEEGIAPEIGPRVMPSLAGVIIGAVNVVGNTFIRQEITKSKKAGDKGTREMQYCLRIGPNPYYNTKVRNNKELVVPEYIVDPTYDKLISVLSSKKTTSTKRNKRTAKKGK